MPQCEAKRGELSLYQITATITFYCVSECVKNLLPVDRQMEHGLVDPPNRPLRTGLSWQRSRTRP